MKKAIFDPSKMRFKDADGKLHISSNRFRMATNHYRTLAYKTDGKDDKGDDPAPDPDPEKEKLFKAIETRVSKKLEGIATKDELEAIRKSIRVDFKDEELEGLRQMADEKTGVSAKLAEMGLRMSRLEAKNKANAEVKDMSVRGQISAWVKENEKALEAIRSGSKVELKPLEIRAVASPMTPATVNVGGSPYIGSVEVEKPINDYLRFPKTFWDTIKKGRTSAATYVWVNKSVPEGDAAFLAPGSLKPGISFAMVAENSIAKKIADSAKAATELLQDIDGMETFIEQELKEVVMNKMNTVLMDSVGTSILPTGIKQLSIAFPAATGLQTANANQMDALRSVVAYMRSGKLTGDITIFINSIDSANMDMAKASDSGVYLLPPFVTADGKSIAGARIIEDSNVPVGTFQAAFLRYYRILIYKDFTIYWGWENDDFTRNLVTAIGEMRIHQFMNTIHTGAFINDTFANVIANITP